MLLALRFLMFTLVAQVLFAREGRCFGGHPFKPDMHVGSLNYAYSLSGIGNLCDDHPEVCTQPSLVRQTADLKSAEHWLVGDLVLVAVALGASLGIVAAECSQGSVALCPLGAQIAFGATMGLSLGAGTAAVFKGYEVKEKMRAWLDASGGWAETDSPRMF